MDKNIYWIALRNINGIGEIMFKRLISEFKTPQRVFEAEKKDLLKIEGIGLNLAEQIKYFEDWESIQKECDRINRLGYRLIKYTDKDYPENLQNTYNPPSFFYIKGDIIPSDNKAIAIVGSRNPDRYGVGVTENLAKDLVKNGFTIVSGLAKGIDTIAHRSALKFGGRTVAVLGSGLDYIYPYENRNLYHEIAQKGAIISEYSLGTKPESGNFPRRNRIISGLALGVLVVQAAENSGSLITADFALEHNREVFAVPGTISSPLSKGTNNLIQRGAKLVTEVEDIIIELKSSIDSDKVQKNESKATKPEELSEDEMRVYKNLSNEPVHIDQLINTTCLTSSQVLSILLNLEIKDLVYQLPGKYYQINN
jgi:DNA processing protein